MLAPSAQAGSANCIRPAYRDRPAGSPLLQPQQVRRRPGIQQKDYGISEFIGRERELAAVSALLEESRLLTLTGAGGSGKTRLAIAAARLAAERDPGLDAAWIELQAVEDPSALALHVAVALGVRSEGGGSAVQAMQAVLEKRKPDFSKF